MSGSIWEVAVDAPIADALSYLEPDHSDFPLTRGLLVSIPLGKRLAKGVLWNQTVDNGKYELKKIKQVDAEFPPLPEPFLRWLEWVSRYYMHPIGSVAALAYPPLGRTSKRKTKRPLAEASESVVDNQFELTHEQKTVIDNILASKNFSAHLIHGVTGSGKTEVYLKVIHSVISSGKTALVLVPEISLTPQLVQRFVARFGAQVAVIHSQLTDRERTNQWWKTVSGETSILIGARSALFCPLNNLGVIIIDEEHEPSFKQDEKLKYHGRDSAVVLAREWNCPILLGSATPSLESWKNCKDGRYILHQMKERVQNRPLPTVEIVDLREKQDPDPKIKVALPSWLSPNLFKGITDSLNEKSQVALFLNRRGVSPTALCPQCGYVHECPNCDISLTLHGKQHLVCHYCDYHESLKLSCPDCKDGQIVPLGIGTEKIEEDVRKLFPLAQVARADRDEIQRREELEELITRMESGEIDILIGTQMIAKGLDFPKLKLVGLVLADIGFNIPDFRSTERSFQLITQVSGRSGRHVDLGSTPGRVIIQTFNPSHMSLKYAQTAQYESFAEEELLGRQALEYPPYGKLINFRISGLDLEKVQTTASALVKRAEILKSRNSTYLSVQILGPAQAPIAKVRNQFRYQVLLKSTDQKSLKGIAHQIIGDESWLKSGTRLLVDVDPLNLL